MTSTSRGVSAIAGATLAMLIVLAAAAAATTASQARAALAASGLTTAELRQRLRDAGQSDDAIEATLAEIGRAGTRGGEAAAMHAPEPRPAEPPPAPKPDTVVVRHETEAPSGTEPFGFDIFRWSPTTFEPLSYGPVDADYPLGPGDELALTLWGDDQLAITAAINREGFVTLPDVGQVGVQGLTLEEARARIRAALGDTGIAPDAAHGILLAVRSAGGIERARKRALAFADEAIAELPVLPDSVYREALAELARLSVDRVA